MNVLLSRAKAGLVSGQAPALKSEELKTKNKETNAVKKSCKQLNKHKKFDPNIPNHKKRWKVFILWRNTLEIGPSHHVYIYYVNLYKSLYVNKKCWSTKNYFYFH